MRVDGCQRELDRLAVTRLSLARLAGAESSVKPHKRDRNCWQAL